jgi:phage/plasmid-like protein (TIGR03299 family)
MPRVGLRKIKSITRKKGGDIMCAAEVESMMWLGSRPWHGLGVEVTEAQTSEEAIIKAGLNWEVEKRPVYLEGGVKIPGYYATVRISDSKPLGVVGERYTVLNNADAFRFFDEVVGTHDAIYETAGSLRGGKLIWILSKLPGHVGWSEDPIEEWLVLSNAHDGSRQVNVLASPVRVVCANTLNVAIQNARVDFEIRHTSGIMDRVVDAREALGLTTMYFEQMGEVMRSLKEFRMAEEEIKKYVYGLFPLKVKNENKLTGFEDVMNVELGPRIKTYIEKVLELTETGKGTDIQGVKGSAYGAFNAAVEFADHWQPVKGKNDSMLFRKLDSLWFGSAARFKQRAFDQICDLVQS